MPTPKSVFGVALYLSASPASDEEPTEISHQELLLLRAFDFVYFDERAPGRFVALERDTVNGVKHFLKQLRAGGAADA